MDKPLIPLEAKEDDVRRRRTNGPMEHPIETQTPRPPGTIAPVTTCVHGRLIDDVLTKAGKRTGQVRCFECGTIFDDPYQGIK
jgi:hypothetical protein